MNQESNAGREDDSRDERDFARRLDEALDARQSLDDACWADAARGDATARELLEGYRVLNEGLRQRRARPQPGPSADLAGRILAQVRADAQTPPPPERISDVTVAESLDRPMRSLPRVVVWAALAAAACLVVAPLLYLQLATAPTPVAVMPNEQPAPAIAKTPDAPSVNPVPGPKVETANDPALRTLVAEAGDRYLELAKETRESFAEVALLLPGVNPHEPPAAKKQWIDQVGDGLKPVTKSVGGAFDFLLQAIPVEEPRS